MSLLDAVVSFCQHIICSVRVFAASKKSTDGPTQTTSVKYHVRILKEISAKTRDVGRSV